jgi:hypothetical protein
VELPKKIYINASFNVSDLSLFDVGDDLRMNPFKERENDVILVSTPRDPIEFLLDPVTRLRAYRFKDSINGHLQDT